MPRMRGAARRGTNDALQQAALDAAVAANRAQLEQLRAWQKDSAPLEKLRQELLAQLENAEDPIQRVRLAESLRPVVTNVLGDDFSSAE